MDLDRAAWFMAGLFIGNFLDTFTTITLLFIWVVIRNQAMPLCLGGFYPQNVLANFFQLLNIWVSLIIPSKMFQNKTNLGNLSDKVPTSAIIQDENNLIIPAPRRARIEEIGESVEIINGITNFSQTEHRQNTTIMKPITLLVRPHRTSKSVNYLSKPIQIILPPNTNPSDYVHQDY